jgi:NADH dehydrogenase (ubiquinone) 1 alpha subcomplex subunit 9
MCNPLNVPSPSPPHAPYAAVNMVGREWETRNFSFEDVHVAFPAMLAEVCKEVGVERLIHVSALGASASNPSAYYKTKVGLVGRLVVFVSFAAESIRALKPPSKLETLERRRLVVTPNPCVYFSPNEVTLDVVAPLHQG